MKYSILLLLLTLSMNLFGQKVIVSTKLPKNVYCGMETGIEVFVEGYRNKPFIVKIDSGILKKVDKYNYTIRSTTKGPIHLSVYDVNGKIIYRDSMNVVLAARPQVFLFGKSSGSITKKTLQWWAKHDDEEDKGSKPILKVIGICVDVDYWVYKAKDYNVKVISGDGDSSSYQITNNELSLALRKRIEGINIGDKIVFESIKISSSCGIETLLEPVEFVVE